MGTFCDASTAILHAPAPSCRPTRGLEFFPRSPRTILGRSNPDNSGLVSTETGPKPRPLRSGSPWRMSRAHRPKGHGGRLLSVLLTPRSGIMAQVNLRGRTASSDFGTGALQTLLANLATRFTASPENLAIEALAHVINGDARLAEAASKLLTGGTKTLIARRFSTQATGPDQARPDLIGHTEASGTGIIVEAKFWAGLTDNQPLAYLSRLPDVEGATLAFVAPGARLGYLWHELAQRFASGSISVGERNIESDEIWAASVGEGKRFALVSWRALLSVLDEEAERCDLSLARSDIRQLNGLCDRMDSEKLMPLSEAELSDHSLARRIIDLSGLALEIGQEAIRRGTVDGYTDRGTKLLSFRSGTATGQYVGIASCTGAIVFDPEAWVRIQHSPLWLRIIDEPAGNLDKARKLVLPTLRNLDGLAEEPSSIWHPIRLRAGVERAELIDDAIAQLAAISAAIASTDASKGANQ